MLIVAAIGAIAASGCSVSGGDEPDVAQGVPFSASSWETEFSNHRVPLEEFVGGGPPKDGIPSIDDPKFVSAEEAHRFLDPVSRWRWWRWATRYAHTRSRS